ncbi:hypothetical protein [Nonomuraea indica]|uniref:hypothetical protein n=1 Tax=Nonomuraea indica TaxID=1581193 RepID=UPI000C7DC496|nr:hypothetical protein [Nonomuraea indica]
MIRFLWRAYSAPAESEAARTLKVLIPLEIAAFAYRLVAPAGWPALSGTTFMQVCLWLALLWFVRQRDQARAEITERADLR